MYRMIILKKTHFPVSTQYIFTKTTTNTTLTDTQNGGSSIFKTTVDEIQTDIYM